MGVINDRIRARRKELGMTLLQLAEKIGVKEATVQRYESGAIKDIGHPTIHAIAEALYATPNYLMGWTDSPSEEYPERLSGRTTVNLKPRLGTIACGQPILAVEEAGEYDEVPSFVNCDYTLVCKGDSMIGAGIRDGDVVYIRQQEEVEQGQIAAVFVDGEVTLKHIYNSGDMVTLVADNPAYPPIICKAGQDVRVLGLMIGYTHMVIRG